MSARSASSFTRRCWRRRCRPCAKAATATAADEQWSPAINLGASVLIPEDYVADLNVRMSLYRRLSGLETRGDIDAFAAELIDRFGPLPDEVKHLFEIVAIKQLALAAGVEKIDAGPKGGTIAFRNNAFANPVALIKLINQHSGTMKVRPDQKIVVTRDWPTPDDRLKGAKALADPAGETGESGLDKLHHIAAARPGCVPAAARIPASCAPSSSGRTSACPCGIASPCRLQSLAMRAHIQATITMPIRRR